MAYATLQQLVDRVGEMMLVALTDRAEVPVGAVDTAVLGRALADTDAVIDGYLAGRYALPMTTVPPLLADIAQAITIWKLHVTEPEAKVKADYEAALRTLREIASGVIRLTEAAGVEPSAPAGSGVRIVDRDRPFTEANMKGFI